MSSSGDALAEQMMRTYEANALARRLLAHLYRWHLDADCGPYRVGPSAETYEATGLDEETYVTAWGHLVNKKLAKPMGSGRGIMIAQQGVRAVEHNLLDGELPVAPRTIVLPKSPPLTPPLPFISNDALREIVRRDFAELNAAHGAGLLKSTALLAGSIAEALLLDVCEANPTRTRRALDAIDKSKNKDKSRRYPDQSSLSDLTAALAHEKVIDGLLVKQVDLLRDHRNLIHPHCEVRGDGRLTAGTVSGLYALVAMLVEYLGEAAADGRLVRYAEPVDEPTS